jgi:putative peptidoglycan lipid II flippase
MRARENCISDRRRIVRSAIWIAAFVAIGKGAGALKEIAIAYSYGAGDVVDAYQLIFTLTTLAPTILVNVLGFVLVPLFVRLSRRSAEDQALFLGELNGVTLLIGSAVALLLCAAWPLVLDISSSGMSEYARALSHRMILGMAPAGVLILFIAIFGAQLQAREKHINTLLECLPASVLFIWLTLTKGHTPIGALVWGTTTGFAAQVAILALLTARHNKASLSMRFSLRSDEWPQIWSAVGVFAIGQTMVSLIAPFDQYMASHFGSGNIAFLGYANRVMALFLSMGAIAIGRATLPVMADMLSRDDLARAVALARKWAWTIFSIAAVLSVVIWITAPWAIKLLFERGAFSATDTAAVATLFRWGVAQIPFYCGMIVFMQFFAGCRRFKAMTVVCVTNFGVKVLLDIFFARYLGTRGLLLATDVMYISAFALYHWMAGRVLRREA